MFGVKDAGEEQRGVDGGEFGGRGWAEAGIHVEEVVEPAVVSHDVSLARTLWAVEEGVERGEDTRGALVAGDPAVIDGDADGGQTKSNGGDAARRGGFAAVSDEAVGGIGPIPEIVEVELLDKIEEGVGIEERVWIGHGIGGASAFVAASVEGGDLVIVGLMIGDGEVAVARGEGQTGVDHLKRAGGTGSAINIVTGNLGVGRPVPMENDGLVAREDHEVSWGVWGSG